MSISDPAKVGIATILSVAALAGGLGWLTNFSPRAKGYDFEVMYEDVAGLMTGAHVFLMGVKVGKVVAVAPQDRMVAVKVHIFEDATQVIKRSRFKIMSQGIIGEKNVEIFPPRKVPVASSTPTPQGMTTANPNMNTANPHMAAGEQIPSYVVAGASVRGDDPARLELVMDELTATFDEFKKSSDPKKFQDLFNKTAQNLYDTTETIKHIGRQAEGIMGGLESTPGDIKAILTGINRLAINADHLVTSARPGEIQAVIRDLRLLSGGLLVTYRNLFGTEASQASDHTIGTVRSLISQIDRLATTLNKTAGDPVLQTDVKDTIRNIRDLTARVTEATALTQPKTLAGFSVHPRLQGVAASTPGGAGLAGNLGLRVNLADNYLHAGIEQVGEGNYVNLAFGDEEVWHATGYHFGLVRSKIGVGIDYGLNQNVNLLGQFYDPFNPTFRVGATYFPFPGSQYGLLAQWARTIPRNENFIWLGVEWRPAN